MATATRKPRTKKSHSKSYSKKSDSNGHSSYPGSYNYGGQNWQGYNSPNSSMAGMPHLTDSVNRMFEELTWRWENNQDGRPWTPRCDWWETSSGFTMCCYVPGCSKSDCSIECTDNSCTVSGCSKPPKYPKAANCYTCECQYGDFQRIFNFPCSIDKSSVKASCKNGVLTVTCKKTSTTKKTSVRVG